MTQTLPGLRLTSINPVKVYVLLYRKSAVVAILEAKSSSVKQQAVLKPCPRGRSRRSSEALSVVQLCMQLVLQMY
jgi:hypothetical protein